MNATIRRVLTSNGLSRRVYFAARQTYRSRRTARAAARYFVNAGDFTGALSAHEGAGTVDLHTTDGLTITIRQNSGDAMTIGEIFFDNCYVRDVTVAPDPVVIDVGGFIGDFSLYAVKRLNARRVIVCEPSPRNWTLLLKNIANNSYQGRIEPINKAVTAGGDVMMNIDATDECQCMVSAHYRTEQALSVVPGISIEEILRSHAVETVDLLKIDCEGGEFEILESVSTDVLRRIRNIVFEFHQIDGVWEKLKSVKGRLRDAGYVLHTRGGLISATRP